MTQNEMDYERVKKTIEYISLNFTAQPNLDEIAAHVHVSPFHFQRMFLRWAGVTPKKFLQYITLENSKRKLEECVSLSEVAHGVGLSGTGRLHDLFINIEGMTPHQYRLKGAGITIYYDFFAGPFGKFLLAITNNDRLCSVQFVEEEHEAEEALKNQWPNSVVLKNREKTGPAAGRIFDMSSAEPIQILARGTPFQIKVWEALLKIPFGQLTSYQGIADFIEHPGALQAVGNAVGRNPVAYLIPCHRVIRKSGAISQYHWGEVRKKAIIGWEQSRSIKE